MKILDTASFPFSGQSLIEASAGTGKTYTIANLYLRLLVGDRVKALTVEQILLVTFTNAATAELRERILARIKDALVDFQNGHSDDMFIQGLIAQCVNQELAIQRLIVAKQNLDIASIFTIHGFCQRILIEEAFDSGVQFERQFLLDESDYLRDACYDYWRNNVVAGIAQDVELLMHHWIEPDALLRDARPLIYRDVAFDDASQLEEYTARLLTDYRNTVQQVKRWWLDNDIADRLQQAGLKKNLVVGKPETWALFQSFCYSENLEFYRNKDSWGIFTSANIEKAKSKTSQDLTDLDFSLFDRLSELQPKVHQGLRKHHLVRFTRYVKSHISNAKSRDAMVSPDDLLANLHDALVVRASHTSLQQKLRNRFPVAMVDEFQDTDSIQYQIFDTIYPRIANDELPALVMIGDPKQAIYGFRGGDIFTYISAKRATSKSQHYTLDKNWRSQEPLVQAINRLFSESPEGFIYKDDIPFHSVVAANKGIPCRLAEHPVPALNIRYLRNDENEGSLYATQRAMDILADECAQTIRHYLQVGYIEQRPIVNQDIAILVRDKKEAEVMKSALATLNIASVFLSKESIFSSESAYSVWLLLNAIENNQSESSITAALLDPIFGFSYQQLHTLKTSPESWSSILNQFSKAKYRWQFSGVASSLQGLLDSFNIPGKLAENDPQAERKLTDIRHLMELLQSQSEQKKSETELLHWLGDAIQQPELMSEQQLRLETDQELVQIVTIHRSKGLQYPMVFIPFASRYKKAGDPFYHDNQHALRYDFEQNIELQQQVEIERIAEDIRLFYVAVTRAQYLCWIGSWNCQKNKSKSVSGFTETAFGHLLFGQSSDELATSLRDHHIIERLEKVFNGVDCLLLLDAQKPTNMNDLDKKQKEVPALHKLTKPIAIGWQLHSYSSISAKRTSTASEVGHDADFRADNEVHPKDHLNSSDEADALELRFRFTKGANAGSFLHDVLEHSDFAEYQSIVQCAKDLSLKYGIESSWSIAIANWLSEVLATPMILSDGKQLTALAEIDSQHMLAEMEFYLPLNGVAIERFNDVVCKALPKSGQGYHIDSLNGMLKGYLDLIFYHEGRYFVADYKSNHLGDSFDDYSQDKMKEVMLHHDYFLQALLYSVALHRFLRSRMTDYSYQQHHGGALYLFLRGMSPKEPENGVFHCKFPEQVITRLDDLFAGGTEGE